jgi:hypothetical protein
VEVIAAQKKDPHVQALQDLKEDLAKEPEIQKGEKR